MKAADRGMAHNCTFSFGTHHLTGEWLHWMKCASAKQASKQAIGTMALTTCELSAAGCQLWWAHSQTTATDFIWNATDNGSSLTSMRASRQAGNGIQVIWQAASAVPLMWHHHHQHQQQHYCSLTLPISAHIDFAALFHRHLPAKRLQQWQTVAAKAGGKAIRCCSFSMHIKWRTIAQSKLTLRAAASVWSDECALLRRPDVARHDANHDLWPPVAWPPLIGHNLIGIILFSGLLLPPLLLCFLAQHRAPCSMDTELGRHHPHHNTSHQQSSASQIELTLLSERAALFIAGDNAQDMLFCQLVG